MKSPKTIAKSLYMLSKKNDTNKVSLAFLDYVKKRHMQKELPNILAHLKHLVSIDNKLNTANIVSAFTLNKDSLQKIKELVGVDKNSKVVLKEDESFFGGFVINYKGLMYDASIKRTLSTLKESLINQE